MESQLPPCPSCASEYTYESGQLLVCPMCAHEWTLETEQAAAGAEEEVTRDVVGNVLQDGDDVTVVKSLRVKGGESIKSGTKVRNIRLLEFPVDGHDIDARIPGSGQIYLKSSVVKKV